MRLLHNIVNEFYLYHQKLNKGLNQGRLLAIIVYKNIFPKDFSLLSNNEGVLYSTIHSKQTYIKLEIDRLGEKLQVLKEEIRGLENLKIKDVKELRLLYLPFFMIDLPGFISFQIAGADIPPEQMVSDTNFEILISGKAKYRYQSSYHQQYIGEIVTLLSSIEKKVDVNNTYKERKKKLDDWNGNRVETLKNEIQKLEQDKTHARNLKIQELLEKHHLEIKITEPKQKSLVTVLLRDGYINEDYLDYVTLFYEGSITKGDHLFLINVKSQIPTEFSHKLQKISKLIPKINELEFDKEYVLNYNLMDEVLNNLDHLDIRNKLFVKLKDESEASIKFIDGFLDSGNDIASFITHLVKGWSNLWTFLETKSNFPEERKEIYFKSVIAYAEVIDIKRLYENNYFKSYLLQKKDFLNVIPQVEKLKSVIRTLDIKFTELDINDVPTKELIEYLYAGNFYALNIGMIKLIMVASDKLNEPGFNTKNYSAISNSGLNKLEEYVHQNINEYVHNVYLKLSDNNQEDLENLIGILNNKDLKVENKLSIIEQVETKVDDLSLIKDLEIHKHLLEVSKCLPIWENIYHYYERNENEVSESIVIFLEKSNNGLELSKTKINTDISGESKYSDFILNLITNSKFSEIAYENILKSVPYSLSSLDLSSLSKNKASLLLNHSILTFHTENYESLKQVFPGLHIQFLENNKSKFLMAISDYEIDNNDLLLILKSTNFALSEKNQIVEKVSEDLIALNLNSIKILGELILASNSYRVTDSILNLILQNSSLSVEQRVRVHNWKYTQIALEEYNAFLNALGEPYSEIAILGKRPLLKNNEYNLKLVDVLNSRNYISKYDIEDKGIRISTFRKANES